MVVVRGGSGSRGLTPPLGQGCFLPFPHSYLSPLPTSHPNADGALHDHHVPCPISRCPSAIPRAVVAGLMVIAGPLGRLWSGGQGGRNLSKGRQWAEFSCIFFSPPVEPGSFLTTGGQSGFPPGTVELNGKEHLPPSSRTVRATMAVVKTVPFCARG